MSLALNNWAQISLLMASTDGQERMSWLHECAGQVFFGCTYLKFFSSCRQYLYYQDHVSQKRWTLPSDICTKQRQISLCSLIKIFIVFIVQMKKFCILGYPKCAQWRFWSDCLNAHADLNLCWACMSEGKFTDNAAHVFWALLHVNTENLKITIWCAAHKKGPYAICGQRRSRSLCTSVLSNLGIFCLSTYTSISTDTVSRQWRPRSACAYVQADLGLHCQQIT